MTDPYGGGCSNIEISSNDNKGRYGALRQFDITEKTRIDCLPWWNDEIRESLVKVSISSPVDASIGLDKLQNQVGIQGVMYLMGFASQSRNTGDAPRQLASKSAETKLVKRESIVMTT